MALSLFAHLWLGWLAFAQAFTPYGPVFKLGGASSTWTYKNSWHDNASGDCSSSSGTTCQATSVAPTAGDALWFCVAFAGANNTISSIADNGATGGSTWVVDSAASGNNGTNGGACGHTLVAKASITTVTATLPAGASNQGRVAVLVDMSFSGPSASLDVGGANTSNTSNCSGGTGTAAGVSLTLSHTTDAIVQLVNSQNTTAAPTASGSFTVVQATVSRYYAYGANLSSGAAPTFTWASGCTTDSGTIVALALTAN